MSNQLATLKTTLTSDKMREQFARALPQHLSPERFIRIALTALTRTPKLADCTQESLMRCLLDLSAFGLEPDGRRAHLIPYKDQCTLVIDWKGLAELAMRSGIIAKLHADIVCEGDEFEFNLGEVTKHKVDFRKPRGDMYAAYALAQTKTGEVFACVLSKDEIEAVRKRSRAGTSGPWVSDYNEMAKKTAFRRLSKWLPLSAEFRDAQERDEEPMEREVTPAVVPPVKLFEAPAKLAESKLTETNQTPLERLREAMENNSLMWDDVAKAANEGGIFVDCDSPASEQPKDVIAEILSVWPQLVASVKGGAQ